MSNASNNIVQSLERAPASRDGHEHNFDQAYAQIVQMQNQDGGPQSQRFQQDMASVNQQLHQDGWFPNLEIVGADEKQGGLITRDIADNRTSVQAAANVNDFGSLGSSGNPGEAAAGFYASVLGLNVTRNGDSSYDVQNPFDNPQNAAAGILSTVFNGMMGGGSDNSAARQDDTSTRDTDSTPNDTPIGMNSWESQAWKGWDIPQDDPD